MKLYFLIIFYWFFDNFYNNLCYENINVIVNMFIFDFLIYVNMEIVFCDFFGKKYENKY